jgi:hypothetical protein
VGALTSRNPMGLHGLEQGYLYLYLTFISGLQAIIALHLFPHTLQFTVTFPLGF